MPGLPWRPIITYGTPATVITLTMPQKLWDYKSQLVGGSRVGSSGVPEAFAIREDHSINLTLRVHDCEYLAVREWIMYAQRTASPFTIQTDSLDPFTVFLCYLDAPTLEDGYAPKRVANFPQVWEVPVTLRRTTAIPFFIGVTELCGTTGVIAQEWILTDAANGSNFRLSVPPPPAVGGSAIVVANLPDPMTDPDVLYISDPAEGVWDTLMLTDGILVPSAVLMESIGPTGDLAWDRAGGFFIIKHMRGSTVLAQATSPQMGAGALVTAYVSYDVSAIGVLNVQADDFIRLELYSYMSLKPAAVDDGYRNTYYYGAVFGPRPRPKLLCESNVEEQ